MPSPTRGKLQKILALELEFQPSEEMTQKVLDFLNKNAVYGAEPAFEGAACGYARAVGLFANSLDPQTGDVHINPELEHQARMEPIREIRKLAQRMAEVLESPHIKTTVLRDASVAESVGRILLDASITETLLDSRRDYFFNAAKREGDPKRARLRLYEAVLHCWYVCKKIEVPGRKRDGRGQFSLNTECEEVDNGPFADFAKGLLALFPDTKRNVSTNELHRDILGIIKHEAEMHDPVIGVTRL